VVEAGRRGLPVLRRAKILAAICRLRRCVAVAGTHGKTSTSAMLAVILDRSGMSPSFVVGGEIVGLGTGARWDPSGEWMVVEADESDGTFLELGAEATVVTSLEPDHLDFWGGAEPLRRAFERFVADTAGPSVLCADDPGAAGLAAFAGGSVLRYGTSASDLEVRIEEVDVGRSGSSFRLRSAAESDDVVGSFSVAAPGLYNVRNAAAALTLAHTVGVGWEAARKGLAAYQGVSRRFQLRGERDGVTYVDDYGHLPTEVASVLSAAAAGGWARIIAVFQPHRYSRTEALWSQFADAFAGADLLIVTDIYPAGEMPRPGVTGELVANAVRAAHPDADVRYVPTLDEVAVAVGRLVRPGDLCLTLGAGDLTRLPDRWLSGEGASDG
jgi:UDP-N-acetylmuramate--alanine ligase